jgi:hypothetical protein
MYRLRDEDLSDEPPAWVRDEAGKIRITGTGLTVAARHQEGAM